MALEERNGNYYYYKNQRAEKWCEDVTELTGIEWRFQLIPQKTFEKMKPQNLSD